MLSLVTVSPVITAFHSCCLSHHVFDQVNLWPAWVGIEIAIFWKCSPGTVETQRLYPLRQGPRRSDQGCCFFWSFKSNYLFSLSGFHSRVRTEFVIVFIGNPFEMTLLSSRTTFLCIADFLSSSWCKLQSRCYWQLRINTRRDVYCVNINKILLLGYIWNQITQDQLIIFSFNIGFIS